MQNPTQIRRRSLKNHPKLILIHSYENFSPPPRPKDPPGFPEDDSRRWYDFEYAPIRIPKKKMIQSPADGSEGKRIICNMPMNHPYQLSFKKGLQRMADMYDIQLEVYDTDWDKDSQMHFTELAIRKDPDLIIHMNPRLYQSHGIYRKIYENGIPVIASNMVPSEEDLPYILCWTGPDDWRMSRALAGKFAESMNYTGAYVLIQHYEGSSCDLARTWGIITELKRIAPEMTCLEHSSTGLNEEKSYEQTRIWLTKYGQQLKGLVTSDSLVQKGANRAIAELDRNDLVCVSHSSPPQCLEFVKRGVLEATTYQSGIIDGILAMQTAVDWFNGFEIPPVRYMPVHIITAEDVDAFIEKKNEYPILEYASYMRALKAGNAEGIREYFSTIYSEINKCSLITIEFCRGVSIEIVSRLISVISERGFNREGIMGSANPSMLANYLFHQPSFERTFEWLEKISLDYCSTLNTELPNRTPITQIVKFVDAHYNEALSLKTLSYRFDLSAAYLGQIFRKETGQSFSVYLNAIRIEQAKKLLENKNLKEYEIAREIGYTDASYFYKIFKKQTGNSPSEYREDLGNDDE